MQYHTQFVVLGIDLNQIQSRLFPLYSWSMPWIGNGNESELANVNGYNTVLLSFIQPDTTYTGGLTFEGTGLQFSSEPQVIKDAIAALRSKGVKVLLAVGGATYHNWAGLNPAGVAAFVNEFSLDGIDIDFEPSDPACAPNGDGSIVCGSDELYISVTRQLRDAIPRPAMVTLATWSVGAYGEGAFAEAAPQGSPYTGVAIRMLREVGDLLDQVQVMAYDAGDSYDAKVAYDAYRAVYSGKKIVSFVVILHALDNMKMDQHIIMLSNPNLRKLGCTQKKYNFTIILLFSYLFFEFSNLAGPILMGVEIPPDAVGGHSTNLDEVRALCEHLKANGGAGIFVWSIQKEATQGIGAADIVALASEVLG